MSADADTADAVDGDVAARLADIEARLDALEADRGDETPSVVIVATKGTLDMAYPPLILASTAAAFGYDVTVFCTFWALDLLHEERAADLEVSAVGNPNVPIPNAVGALPGMDRATTAYMSKRIADNDTATIPELVETGLDMGVDFQACQMTMDLLDYDAEAFYDGVTTGVGAAGAVNAMGDADVQLLV